MSERFSNAQRLIWSGQVMHPGSSLYNMILLFKLDGPVNVDAFRRAFFAVATASDVLTATIGDRDGDAHLQPGTAVDFFDSVDLSKRQDPESELVEWVNDRKRREFDLNESLIDSVLIRISDQSFAWYFNAHHLVTDGWSAGLVFDEVQKQYEKELSNDLKSSLELPPYSALLEFEEKVSETARYARAVSYWDDVATSPFVTPKLYRRQTSLRTTSSDRRTVRLSTERMAALRRLSKHEHVRGLTEELSFHSIILSILGVFVARVSGETTFAVSMPTHNRPTVALRNTIGVFVELFPVVMSVDPEIQFLNLVASVRKQAQQTFQHALPGLGRPELNRRSVVALNYVNAKFASFAGMPVRTEWIHCDHFDSNHVLRLHVHDFDGSGELTLHFDFATDTFSHEQQDAAISHFMNLLDSLVANPVQAIGQPPLLTPENFRSPVHDSGGAPPPTHESKTKTTDVLSRFLSVVRDSPNAIAVADESNDYTYVDLLNHAEKMTAQLSSAGVKPGDRVLIFLDRGIGFVAAILACLIGRVAYVPVERTNAIERAKTILNQSKPAAIITDADGLLDSTVPVVRPGLLEQPREQQSSLLAISPESQGDDPAYVIFTSGSTGIPKGVVVTRDSLSRYVGWASTAFSAPGPVSMPLFTSLSYDLAVTSVFVPLVTGGTVRIYRSTDPFGDASLIRQVLAVDDHTVIKLTPSHLQVAADVSPQLSLLQSLVLGGEALTTEIASLFNDKFGGRVRIINEYGPTEATVGCMVHEYAVGDNVGSTVPIGKANPYSEILLLDTFGNSVPDGVTGELIVAGPGLASGYLNSPDVTAKAFVSHPLRPGQRAYRTGDAAVRDSSGVLTYLGRIDEQLKISGVRIEPGEIEARIREIEGITGVAVLVEQPERKASAAEEAHCKRCGLSTDHPATILDEDGICNVCRRFDNYRPRASSYFRESVELDRLFSLSREKNPDSPYDCLALLSGGKDSTYVLGQLVDRGLRVHAFTLDNGYLSDEAKANIRRVVAHLDVSHEFAKADSMNEIFVDSLRRHSNVCNGCFKTIYTLALKRADELSIPVIVTGLSRGQFFETRLTPELFESASNPLEQIDDTVLAARKAYHKVDDAVRRSIDTTFLREGALLDDIQFVDFFRYTDVSLDEMLTYLDERLPWVRPTDTGRSTNCLINDVGIFVHKKERGYHNYSWPYSWDVRVGHKERDAALDELDDQIDEEQTKRILNEIGYTIRRTPSRSTTASLHAYYVAPTDVAGEVFRATLSQTLPHQTIPRTFTRVDAIPLTANGKVDRAKLAETRTADSSVGLLQPKGEIEKIVHDIWCELLGTKEVSTDAPFLDSGGSSILGIQVIARVSHAFDISLPFTAAFQAPTIMELSALVETTLLAELDADSSDAKSQTDITI